MKTYIERLEEETTYETRSGILWIDDHHWTLYEGRMRRAK